MLICHIKINNYSGYKLIIPVVIDTETQRLNFATPAQYFNFCEEPGESIKELMDYWSVIWSETYTNNDTNHLLSQVSRLYKLV